MNPPFRFRRDTVHSHTTDRVREAVEAGRSCVVAGPAGSGKSHAVRAALPTAVWSSLRAGALGPLQFLYSIARQLGVKGEDVTKALWKGGGLLGILTTVNSALGDRVLVVDHVHTNTRPNSLEEPAEAIWDHELDTVLEWLDRRMDGGHTVQIKRWAEPGRGFIEHKAPQGWTHKLESAPDGFRDWQGYASLVGNNPAALALGRATLPFGDATAFNRLVYEAKEEGQRPGEVIRSVAGIFRRVAPQSWRQVLAALVEAGSCERDDLLSVVEAVEPGSLPVLERLIELGLVEDDGREIGVVPCLAEAGIVERLAGEERIRVLKGLAQRWLRPVNSVQTLDPVLAERVYRAHALYVELGDFSAAERTARRHLNGLVDLARRNSLAGELRPAWDHYNSLYQMIQVLTPRDQTEQHIHSYIRHYRASHGLRLGLMEVEDGLADYQSAVEGWPENALWHQRVLAELVRQGRVAKIREALGKAEKQVPEHPRRAEMLRLRPAEVALDQKLVQLAVELLEPTLELTEDRHPVAVDLRSRLLGRLAEGVSVCELEYRREEGRGNIVFLGEERLRLWERGRGWELRLAGVDTEAEGSGPSETLERAAAAVGQRLFRLVSTPSTRLSEKEQREKALLLSRVDVLNSDVGFAHATERWLLGRIESGEFVPIMQGLPRIALGGQSYETEEGLYLARVRVGRDGYPEGAVRTLEAAGSVQEAQALRGLIERHRDVRA